MEQDSVVITVDGLTKVFGHTSGAVSAADDVSFEIRRGETLGLVGESGSGKTTVGRCILRLVQPDAGKIRFHGTEIQDLSPREMRSVRGRIQMVFQDPLGSMNPAFTLRQTLRDALRHVEPRDGREPRIAELLNDVGLSPTLLERRPTAMSGGQLQRAGIARALASHPEFVFLDEPTSSLDLSVRGQIINLLADIQAERRLAYLFASHDLAVVGRLASRLIVMFHGRVMEAGPVREVFSNPQHPYTEQLMIGTDLRATSQHRARRVGATMTASVNGDPAGARCRYADRCPYVHDRCLEAEPPLIPVAADRGSRCWLAEPQPFDSATDKPTDVGVRGSK